MKAAATEIRLQTRDTFKDVSPGVAALRKTDGSTGNKGVAVGG